LPLSFRAALAAVSLSIVDAAVLSTVGAAANDMTALVARPVALPDMVIG